MSSFIKDVKEENEVPVVTQIVLTEVPVGPASTFRQTINTNFNNIRTEFQEVYDMMVNIQLSSVQPTDQKVGDFWFKII